MKNLIRLLLLILVVSMASGPLASCKSEKAECYASSFYKKKHKKNHSNYAKKYGYKNRPVRKDYVIKNKKGR
ncbi:MAG TPA: hypothetical protein VMC08_01545 [Bacteroidales bacterium]|nr:hypothetical protein [Bacteroidales bacterium]